MNQEVINIGKKWEIVVEIKRRCQNATPEDMDHLTELVTMFNSYMIAHVERFNPIRRITACQLPQICGQVAGFLKIQGLINSPFDTKLNNIEYVHKF